MHSPMRILGIALGVFSLQFVCVLHAFAEESKSEVTATINEYAGDLPNLMHSIDEQEKGARNYAVWCRLYENFYTVAFIVENKKNTVLSCDLNCSFLSRSKGGPWVEARYDCKANIEPSMKDTICKHTDKEVIKFEFMGGGGYCR